MHLTPRPPGTPGAEDIASAKERGWRDLAPIDDAYQAGEITAAEWHAAVLNVIEPAYLNGDNPRAQSGHSGDETRWREARSLLVDLLPPDGGTFLDIGCANGHLMESLTAWAAEARIAIEPYGVEISTALADLARTRCPQWADRIWTANAMGWKPPHRFDAVRTGLDYVPADLHGTYVAHLLHHVVTPGGRLIIGVYNEERDRSTMQDLLRSCGHIPAGTARADHRHAEIQYKGMWVANTRSSQVAADAADGPGAF
ncbi:class I SAM-dependent methyltransferase [Kitasatospora hibisci]|uniref:class I SAM-dependent methyltransferase n=1 Tax=Kitasatospora hibisci TaxID=3369522 RepID=UPI003753F903